MDSEIYVRYYALLREIRGVSQETLPLKAHSVSELYDELRANYGFPLEKDRLKVAVNDCFCGWDQPLKPGDKVVFIPPVAGG